MGNGSAKAVGPSTQAPLDAEQEDPATAAANHSEGAPTVSPAEGVATASAAVGAELVGQSSPPPSTSAGDTAATPPGREETGSHGSKGVGERKEAELAQRATVRVDFAALAARHQRELPAWSLRQRRHLDFTLFPEV